MLNIKTASNLPSRKFFLASLKKVGLVTLSMLILSGCSTFSEKDNTPEPKSLAQFTPTIKPKLLWSASTGKGTGDEYLKNGPVIHDSIVYTSSINGLVTAIDKNTGHLIWQKDTRKPIINAPGVGNDMVVVTSREGDVTALDSHDGHLLWHNTIEGEALAAPAIAKNKVIIKTIDGTVRALSSKNGKQVWHFQQVEPNLILRAASKPVTHGDDVLLGFANGTLAKLTLDDGQLLWTKAIATPTGAFTIQRMIDVDATPIIYKRHVYAASYQGRLAALDWYSGNTLWSNEFSSYTGITAHSQHIFASDTKSYLWAFNSHNGHTDWKQTELAWRNISGPATLGNYVIVGDSQGFLHWIKANNGQFAARTYASGAIYAAPITDNGVLYALTSKGRLLAYSLT